TIKLRPNLRSSAFRYLAHSGYTSSDLHEINKIIRDGYVCDDAFYLDYTRSLSSAKVLADSDFDGAISEAVDVCGSDTFYRFYSTMSILVRFRRSDYIMPFIERNQDIWRHDDHLGRIVGGLAPIARRDDRYQELSSIILQSLNRSALSVFNFHYKVRT